MNRRELLLAGVSAAAAGSLAYPGTSRAQAPKEVTIGVIYPMSGASAQVGIDARNAFLRQGHWELVGATRFAGGDAPQRIETTEIATNLTPEFVQERLAMPETISIYDLPRKIAAARSFGLSANSFAMHFHSLVALPALIVAMTLIAATVSMRFSRMGQSATIILGGVMAGFLLYVVSVLVKAFGTAGFVPPVAAAWLPVLVASFFGVTFLLYKEDG